MFDTPLGLRHEVASRVVLLVWTLLFHARAQATLVRGPVFEEPVFFKVLSEHDAVISGNPKIFWVVGDDGNSTPLTEFFNATTQNHSKPAVILESPEFLWAPGDGRNCSTSPDAFNETLQKAWHLDAVMSLKRAIKKHSGDRSVTHGTKDHASSSFNVSLLCDWHDDVSTCFQSAILDGTLPKCSGRCSIAHATEENATPSGLGRKSTADLWVLDEPGAQSSFGGSSTVDVAAGGPADPDLSASEQDLETSSISSPGVFALTELHFEPASGGGVTITDDFMTTYSTYSWNDGSSSMIPGAAHASAARFRRWQHVSSALHETWLQPRAAKGRVVAVMSTTPTRIMHMQLALDSVISQRHALDVVYVFVPRLFLRTNSAYEIPSWLQHYHDAGAVIVKRCDDSGPGTAVLAVLDWEREATTTIFKVDDDQIYGPNTLSILMHGTGVLPGRALTLESSQFFRHAHGVILEGVHGVIFRRGWLDQSVHAFEGAAGPLHKYCWLQDDLWLTMNLAKKSIRRESLDLRRKCCLLPSASQPDALSAGGAGTDNHQNFYLCNAAVLQYYPDFWTPKPRTVVMIPASDHDTLYRALGVLDMSQQRPHQVYLCGASGWGEFHRGGWYEGYVVTPLPDCPPTSSMADLLYVGAELEEEPNTIMIACTVDDLASADFMNNMVVCMTRKGPLSAQSLERSCTSPTGGGRAMWRAMLALPDERPWNFELDSPMFDSRALPPLEPLPPMQYEFLNGLEDIDIEVRLALEHWDRYGALPVPVATVLSNCGSRTQKVFERAVSRFGGALTLVPTFSSSAEHSEVLPRLADVIKNLDARTAFLTTLVDSFVILDTGNIEALFSSAVARPGSVVALRVLRFRGVSVPVGLTFFPPGVLGHALLDTLPQGDAPCAGHGTAAVWLAAQLAARGVTVHAALGESAATGAADSDGLFGTEADENAWSRCLESLWPSLGHKLVTAQPRVVMLLKPIREDLLSDLSESERRDFQRFSNRHNLDLLEAQSVLPSAVYVVMANSSADDGFEPRLLGGPDGAEVRGFSCEACQLDTRKVLGAALEVELQEDTLIIAVSAERLVDDQLVARLVHCAQQLLWVSIPRGFCGTSGLVAGGLEVALLRKQVASLDVL